MEREDAKLRKGKSNAALKCLSTSLMLSAVSCAASFFFIIINASGEKEPSEHEKYNIEKRRIMHKEGKHIYYIAREAEQQLAAN